MVHYNAYFYVLNDNSDVTVKIVFTNFQSLVRFDNNSDGSYWLEVILDSNEYWRLENIPYAFSEIADYIDSKLYNTEFGGAWFTCAYESRDEVARQLRSWSGFRYIS